MKISDLINDINETTSGGIAIVAQPIGKVIKRPNPSVFAKTKTKENTKDEQLPHCELCKGKGCDACGGTGEEDGYIHRDLGEQGPDYDASDIHRGDAITCKPCGGKGCEHCDYKGVHPKEETTEVKNPDGHHHTSNEPFIDPDGPQDEGEKVETAKGNIYTWAEADRDYSMYGKFTYEGGEFTMYYDPQMGQFDNREPIEGDPKAQQVIDSLPDEYFANDEKETVISGIIDMILEYADPQTEELNDLRKRAGLEVRAVSEDSNEFENNLAMEFVELPLASMSKEEIEDQMSEIFKTIYHMGMEDEPETDAGNAMEELAHAVDDNGGYHNDDWRYPLEAEEISDEDVQAIIRHQQTVKDIIGHATEESAPVEEADELNDIRKRAGLEVKERYKDQGIADTVKDQRGKEFQFDKSTKKFKSLDGEEAAVNTKLGKDLLRLRRNQMKKSTPSYNR